MLVPFCSETGYTSTTIVSHSHEEVHVGQLIRKRLPSPFPSIVLLRGRFISLQNDKNRAVFSVNHHPPSKNVLYGLRTFEEFRCKTSYIDIRETGVN